MRYPPRQGFTLIETLAAVLLMALIIPIAMQGITQGLRTTAQIQHQQRALTLAEHKLQVLLASGDWDISARSGDFDSAVFGSYADNYRWSLDLEAWRDPNLRRLRISVSWSSEANDQVTLETLVMPESTL